MDMMNKYAKFDVNSLSGHRLKIIPVSALELSERANFMYNLV